MEYELRSTSAFEQQVRKADRSVYLSLKQKIERLRTDPTSTAKRRLGEHFYETVVGNYRLYYSIRGKIVQLDWFGTKDSQQRDMALFKRLGLM